VLIATFHGSQQGGATTMNGDWLADDIPVRYLCGRMVCTRYGYIGADVRRDWRNLSCRQITEGQPASLVVRVRPLASKIPRRTRMPYLWEFTAVIFWPAAFFVGGAAHRLSDPRTVRSAPLWRRITVHHASAAVADALSTALCAASAAKVAAVPRAFREHWPSTLSITPQA
jgi:hypothetical protein